MFFDKSMKLLPPKTVKSSIDILNHILSWGELRIKFIYLLVCIVSPSSIFKLLARCEPKFKKTHLAWSESQKKKCSPPYTKNEPEPWVCTGIYMKQKISCKLSGNKFIGHCIILIFQFILFQHILQQKMFQ